MTGVELAVLTTAATAVGMEAMKGLGGAAGGDLWTKIKGILGFSEDPAREDLAQRIAERLVASPELGADLGTLIKDSGTASAQMLGRINVGQITAKNVAVAERIDRVDFH